MKTFMNALKYNWSLFKLDNVSSKNYFETYQKNKELHFLHEKNETNDPNILNNIYANEIIYGNLKKKVWTFIDLKDFKHYEVFNIIMLPGPIIIYFFNINDPCFLIQNYAYMDFFYFGRIKIKALVEISYSTSGNNLQLPVIENNLNIIYNIGLNTKTPVVFNKTILFFGFMNNPGHHLWNEISGLFYFLNEKNNINLIDSIAIGKYDFFNIKKYLTDVYNIKTINYNEDNYPVFLNIYPVFLYCIFIDNVTTNPLKRFMILDMPYTITNNSKKIQIVLDIRTNSRIILNITELYIFIIKTLYQEISSQYKLNIVFTGRFLTNLNNIDLNYDKEIHDQNLIVSKIINNFTDSNIVFDNLIGKSFENIINHVHNADLMIVIFGTSAPNLVNWICNTKTIGFVQPFNYHIYHSIQTICLKNDTCLAIPSNCFKSVDKNLNCIIDLTIFYEYFYNTFIKLL
jgi:hypothetical protein